MKRKKNYNLNSFNQDTEKSEAFYIMSFNLLYRKSLLKVLFSFNSNFELVLLKIAPQKVPLANII